MSLLDKLKITSPNDEEMPSEFGSEFIADPEPDEKPVRARKTPAKKPTPARSSGSAGTARLAKQVAEDLETLIAGGAAIWGLTDQCCAPVLEEDAKPIATALTAILARNPRMLAAFASTDIAVYTVQSLALGRALSRTAKAFYRNHISGAQEGDTDATGGGINLASFPAYRPS
jgi:hypothetical protein